MLGGKKYKRFEHFYQAVDWMQETERILGGVGLTQLDQEAYQPCFKKFSFLRDIEAVKYINYLNHYVYKNCEYGTMCFCVRERFENVTVTTHEVGNCPLCMYRE